jgi:Fe-S-cluster containining protein
MCGECCKGFGGTIVTEEDIQRIAGFIGTDPGRFVDTYCQMSGDKPVLAQGGNGDCLFLDGVCAIHPVKPRMCRAWPFIRPVLVDVVNWHSMATACPGMRTDVTDEDIQACVEKVLQDSE